MRIVVKNVGCNPKVKEIEGSLQEMQKIVGGYIQCMPFPNNILCVLNEEGKLMNLQPNFVYNSDVIVGNVFFCSAGEEEFESLTEEQTEFIMETMHFYEMD